MHILILNIPTQNFTMTGDELIVFSCCGMGVYGRTSGTFYRGHVIREREKCQLKVPRVPTNKEL